MENKKIIILLLLFSLIMVNFSSALTGKIGNARAILDAEVGETIDRTVKIINSNNESVKIELFTSGDLADDINILDNNFTLEPGEEKRARFKIYISKGGTTESNVNVKFSPLDDGNGVGMTSTLIIKAEKKGIFDSFFGKDNDIIVENDENKKEGSKPSITGNVIGNKGINVATIITVLLIMVFIFLAFILGVLIFKKNPTKLKKEMI